MKKAIIKTGSKQYVVTEGEVISVELLAKPDKSVSFEALLITDGKTTKVGNPYVANASVVADVISEDSKADKVTAIRYKAKKRVHKVHGHRQHQTILKISSIS